MPTSRGWAAIGVALALLTLWVGFGELELMTTAVFLLMAVLVGTFFVRVASPRVAVSRQLFPAQVHEGDVAAVQVDVMPGRRLRNVFVDDMVHGLGMARFAAAAASPSQPLVAHYEVHCRARGVYQVGPAEVSVSDAFGLSEHRRSAGGIDRLTVYPRIERLRGFPAVRGMDPAVQSTRPTFAPHGGDDFFTLREYHTGDDLRRVHWPSSAKRDSLMIKQLEVPWQSRALVLLDVRAERYPTPEAFEQAVRGAASAVTHLHQGGFSPDVWTSERASGPRSGSRYQQAMDMLAAIQPTEHLDLRRTVTRLRRQRVGGGALVLVTGSPDDGVIGAYRILAKDFTRAIVMVVGDRSADSIAAFQRAGAVTVTARPDGSWASAWRTAMEMSWSTA